MTVLKVKMVEACKFFKMELTTMCKNHIIKFFVCNIYENYSTN